MKARLAICDVGFLEKKDIFGEIYKMVPEYRRKKVDAYRFAKDKHLSLAAGYLLHRELEQIGVHESELDIAYSDNGHPYYSNRTDLHFSLAHSGKYAMCIIGDAPVGCDVEMFEGNEDIDLVHWTQMESYLKATDGVIDEVVNMKSFAGLGYDFSRYEHDDNYIFMTCVEQGTIIMEDERNEYYFKCGKKRGQDYTEGCWKD